LFLDDDLSAMAAQSGLQLATRVGPVLDVEWMRWGGGVDALLAAGAAHAVRRKRRAEIGLPRDFRVGVRVVTHDGDDRHGVCACAAGQPLQVGDDALRAGHVELAVWDHEVVLRVLVPEDDGCHDRYDGPANRSLQRQADEGLWADERCRERGRLARYPVV